VTTYKGLAMEQNFYSHKLSVMTGQTWEVEHTGGGCMALVCHLVGHPLPELSEESGFHYLMVTDEGAGIPEPFEACMLGEYVNDYPVNYWSFNNQHELISFLSVWGATRTGGSL
jgi:hypothetical protein